MSERESHSPLPLQIHIFLLVEHPPAAGKNKDVCETGRMNVEVLAGLDVNVDVVSRGAVAVAPGVNQAENFESLLIFSISYRSFRFLCYTRIGTLHFCSRNCPPGKN